MAEHPGDKGKSSGRERLIQAAQALAKEHPFEILPSTKSSKELSSRAQHFITIFPAGKKNCGQL